MKYFITWYRLDGKDRYLIWTWDEHSGETLLVVDPAGFIPSFENPEGLRKYAARKGYELENEKPRLHDLDWAASWTRRPRRRFDCKKALHAWNLFIDIAASIGERGSAFKTLDKSPSTIYEKLFGGNNLPSMTPKGERFVPEWSLDEVRVMAELLSVGLQTFMQAIRSWPRVRRSP